MTKRILLLAGFLAIGGPAFAESIWKDPPPEPKVIEALPLPIEAGTTGSLERLPADLRLPALEGAAPSPLRRGCTVTSYGVGEGAIVRVHRC
jgi:hypothetical protein